MAEVKQKITVVADLKGIDQEKQALKSLAQLQKEMAKDAYDGGKKQEQIYAVWQAKVESMAKAVKTATGSQSKYYQTIIKQYQSSMKNIGALGVTVDRFSADLKKAQQAMESLGKTKASGQEAYINKLAKESSYYGDITSKISAYRKELAQLQTKGVTLFKTGQLKDAEQIKNRIKEVNAEIQKTASEDFTNKLEGRSKAYEAMGDHAGALKDKLSMLRAEMLRQSEAGLTNTASFKKLQEEYKKTGEEIDKLPAKTTKLTVRVKNLIKSFVSAQAILWVVRRTFMAFKTVLLDSTQAIADAEETANLFLVTFKGIEDQATATSNAIANMAGVARSSSQKSLSSMASFFQGLGSTASESLRMSEEYLTRIMDVVSLRNIGGDINTIISSMVSAAAGNTENYRKMSVIVREAAVKAELARQGLDKLTGTELELAKVQARVNIFMEQTEIAAGDMQRTFDSAVNVTRRLKEASQELKENLGSWVSPWWTELKKDLLELEERWILAARAKKTYAEQPIEEDTQAIIKERQASQIAAGFDSSALEGAFGQGRRFLAGFERVVKNLGGFADFLGNALMFLPNAGVGLLGGQKYKFNIQETVTDLFKGAKEGSVWDPKNYDFNFEELMKLSQVIGTDYQELANIMIENGYKISDSLQKQIEEAKARDKEIADIEAAKVGYQGYYTEMAATFGVEDGGDFSSLFLNPIENFTTAVEDALGTEVDTSELADRAIEYYTEPLESALNAMAIAESKMEDLDEYGVAWTYWNNIKEMAQELIPQLVDYINKMEGIKDAAEDATDSLKKSEEAMKNFEGVIDSLAKVKTTFASETEEILIEQDIRKQKPEASDEAIGYMVRATQALIEVNTQAEEEAERLKKLAKDLKDPTLFDEETENKLETQAEDARKAIREWLDVVLGTIEEETKNPTGEILGEARASLASAQRDLSQYGMDENLVWFNNALADATKEIEELGLTSEEEEDAIANVKTILDEEYAARVALTDEIKKEAAEGYFTGLKEGVWNQGDIATFKEGYEDAEVLGESGIGGGFTSILLQIASQLEVVQAASTIISDTLIPMLDAFLSPLMPVIKSIAMVITDILSPLLELLFPVVKTVAVVLVALIGGIAASLLSIWDAIVNLGRVILHPIKAIRGTLEYSHRGSDAAQQTNELLEEISGMTYEIADNTSDTDAEEAVIREMYKANLISGAEQNALLENLGIDTSSLSTSASSSYVTENLGTTVYYGGVTFNITASNAEELNNAVNALKEGVDIKDGGYNVVSETA